MPLAPKLLGLLSTAAIVFQKAALISAVEATSSDDGPESTTTTKKPRPKAYLLRENEKGMKMQLLPADSEGVPLVGPDGLLRPDLNPEDFEDEPGVIDVSVQNRDVRIPMDEEEAAELEQELKEKKEARERKKKEKAKRMQELLNSEGGRDDKERGEDEDEDEEDDGEGTISSGALKSKSKSAAEPDQNDESKGKKEKKPRKRLFEDRFQEAVEACSDFRSAKKSADFGEGQLEELLEETKNVVSVFMTDSLKSYKDNHTMVMRLGQLVTPPKAGERNALIQECYARDAIELSGAWGLFYEDFAQIDMCLKHTKSVTEFEGRCFTSRMASALQSYHGAGDSYNFDRLWEALQVTRDKQDQKLLVTWRDRMMFPRLYMPGLKSRMVWERKHSATVRHIMEILENHTDIFRKDLQELIDNNLFVPVDDSLVLEGSWERATLYDGMWNSETCPHALNSCSMFRYELPGRNAELPYWYENHEEVTFYRASPGTKTLPHAGFSNGRINIQIGLEGLQDSSLALHKSWDSAQTLEWKTNEAIAFNDGRQRTEQTGSEERFILEVGIFHPDITVETYIANHFNGRTMAGDYGKETVERLESAPKAPQKRRRRRKNVAADEL